MSVILHITKREEWERAKLAGVYRGDTLESEGFIHCSEPQQVIPVANTWFPGQKGLILLCIDSQKVGVEIRYEGVGGGERFPHIYGPLNLDAVFQVIDFEPAEDGKFVGSIPFLQRFTPSPPSPPSPRAGEGGKINNYQ